MRKPVAIRVRDYHDFRAFKPLEKMGIKIKELGCIREYIAIAYEGKLTDKHNIDLYTKLKKQIKKNEEQYDE